MPPLIFQTEEDLRKQVRPVLELLVSGEYEKARAEANRLTKEQIPYTRITNIAHDYVTTLIRENLEEARKVIAHFTGRPYNWHCWLPLEPQLTLKNTKTTPNYG